METMVPNKQGGVRNKEDEALEHVKSVWGVPRTLALLRWVSPTIWGPQKYPEQALVPKEGS